MSACDVLSLTSIDVDECNFVLVAFFKTGSTLGFPFGSPRVLGIEVDITSTAVTSSRFSVSGEVVTYSPHIFAAAELVGELESDMGTANEASSFLSRKANDGPQSVSSTSD